VVAVVLSRPALPEDVAFLDATPAGTFTPRAEDVYARGDVDALPKPTERLVPFLDAPLPQRPADGITLARLVAQRAYVPASNFPVGCVLVTGDGRLLPGVNVEHADWSRILCAERNALGTAMTWGRTDLTALYLTCPKDPNGTPCGACRQLLVELAPASELWMDRGNAPAASSAPERLLPGAFRGNTLLHRP
jgi:cytidine deaminase